MWRPQVQALTQFRCLAPDLPAHGANVHVPWTTIRGAAEWVAEYIEREAPGRRAHIVGLSLGAVIGYELLAAFPDSVDRLVLTGGMGLGKPGPTIVGRVMRASMWMTRIPWIVSATLAAMRVPREDRELAHRDMMLMSSSVTADMVDQVLSYHVAEVLRTRPHRVLAMAGSMDVAAIRRTVRQVGEMMPAARTTIIPRGLHTWNWQFPELFNRTVVEWLSHDS